MRKVFIYTIVAMMLSCPLHAFSDPINDIKLAVFDNSEVESTNPSLTENVKVPYMEGIKTAIYVARRLLLII